jgi:low affinity Fe/Cu permease
MKSIAMPGLTGRHSIFDRFAGAVTRLAGTPWAFAVAVLSIVLWAATGPVFHFSENWQMVVNTGTTIVTFLMVFLIQQSQNKDSLAVHIKLNELLAAHELASNRVVAVEDLDEADLETLRKFYCELAKLAEKEGGVKSSHSLDDAQDAHARKRHGVDKAPKKSTRRAATKERA